MKKCKRCNRIHVTPLDYRQLSETQKKQLKRMGCSTFKEGYKGSLLTATHNYEYYSPIVEKRLEIRTGEEEPEEEEIEENSYEDIEYQIQESDWEAFEQEENDE